ncbi:AAA family ATPase [Neorhizobium alkalisoli]|uniref:Adenylate kinase family enzyme n=1 Tax=Neorhizobium alkalisoli TaxID=528178 RepID=A0A561QIY0_9HYPH|nr:AAA family ATPase [Neorhizobium alkalisoli]TWF50328.1 adenylate kinase family enzyme [Neorhizobium alkalisoli]
MVRIHVMGASGSGATSLGRALSAALAIRHIDSDDIYWMPTDPPYTTPRVMDERVAMLVDHAPVDGAWVLSGSALKWGMAVEPFYDLIVFLLLDPQVRMERIRRREVERYGDRIAPGGDMAQASGEFIEWAESYDTAGPERRSRASHEAWLLERNAPILRLDSIQSVEELVQEVLRHPVVAGRMA